MISETSFPHIRKTNPVSNTWFLDTFIETGNPIVTLVNSKVLLPQNTVS